MSGKLRFRAVLLMALLVSGGCGEAGSQRPALPSPSAPAESEAPAPVPQDETPVNGPAEEPAFASVVRAACEGVGEVRAVSGGSRGVPILLLEERHDSRAGQIEQCVDGPMASAQSHPELIEEIDRRARQLSVDLEPEDKQAMAEYLGFLRGRGEANQTIARATGRVADQQSLPMVALTMGAGHTEAMVEDENGRFPITLSSVAGVAGTEEAARNIVLTR